MDTAFTISYGDTPEALDNVLDIMRDCGAVLEVEAIQSGEELYRREIKEGILPEIFESIKRTKLLLKAPTKKPKSNDYIEVMDAISEKLGAHTKIEYYVSKATPGVGLVVETDEKKISPQILDDVSKAALRLGGYEFAYSMNEAAALFEDALAQMPQLKAKYHPLSELEDVYTNFDIIFTTHDCVKVLKKAIKPEFGCNIYLGNGYALFEPIEDYNYKNKGLLLAAALMIKYSGQPDAAWAIYGKLESK